MMNQLAVIVILISTALALPLIRPKRSPGDGNYGDNSVFRNQTPGSAGQPQTLPNNKGYNSQYNDRNMNTLGYSGEFDQYNRDRNYQNYPSNNERNGYDSRYNNDRYSNNSPYYSGSTSIYDRNSYNNGYNSNSNSGLNGDRYSDSRYNGNSYNDQQDKGILNRTSDWLRGLVGRK